VRNKQHVVLPQPPLGKISITLPAKKTPELIINKQLKKEM
jgi:hypothetical protein